jgi:hypothetical protein
MSTILYLVILDITTLWFNSHDYWLWLTYEGRISGTHFQHVGQKFFYEKLTQGRARSDIDGVFWYTKHLHYTLVWIWLWNQPAIRHTNDIVHLRVYIWKCCVFHENIKKKTESQQVWRTWSRRVSHRIRLGFGMDFESGDWTASLRTRHLDILFSREIHPFSVCFWFFLIKHLFRRE